MISVCSLPEGSLKNKVSYSASALLGTDFDLEPSICRFVREDYQKHCQQLNSFFGPSDYVFPRGLLRYKVRVTFIYLNLVVCTIVKRTVVFRVNESRVSW